MARRVDGSAHRLEIIKISTGGIAGNTPRLGCTAAGTGKGSCMCVGNLHLPAKARAIYARLISTVNACQYIERMTQKLWKKRRSREMLLQSEIKFLKKDVACPLDGCAIMVGDFNTNPSDYPLKLLTHDFVLPKNTKKSPSRTAAATKEQT